MTQGVVIDCMWEGDLPLLALEGGISLYRSNCHTLSILKLAESLKEITANDVNEQLLGGGRRQIAEKMLKQAEVHFLIEPKNEKFVLTDWGRESLNQDKKAWIDYSTGAWMLLLGDGLKPIIDGLSLIPVVALNEKSDPNYWGQINSESSQLDDHKTPALIQMLNKIENGISFHAWFMNKSEKLLITPSSCPPKTFVRAIKTFLKLRFNQKDGWRVLDVKFPNMKSLGKMQKGICEQTLNGESPEFFQKELNTGGYALRPDGKYTLMNFHYDAENYDMQNLLFRYEFKKGRWNIRFTGQLAAKNQHEALVWFINYGLESQGVLSTEELLKKAGLYLERAGLSKDGIDLSKIKSIFKEVQPEEKNRAIRSRLVYPLLFETT